MTSGCRENSNCELHESCLLLLLISLCSFAKIKNTGKGDYREMGGTIGINFRKIKPDLLQVF
jgi:hypothetical protein